MKANFLFAGLNQNRIIQKKNCQKKAHFLDGALKPRGIIYLNVVDLVFVCPPYQNFWLRAWGCVISVIFGSLVQWFSNCAPRHTSVPQEILRCAAELFGIIENNQFVLQLGMQASMRDLNANYP